MMTVRLAGTPIGAMRYNGVAIGEAMMDGHIVFRSVIRVAAPVPTFLSAAPWVSLPSIAGVTYSISGTPGYGQSVIVSAAAQPGYELVGTFTWSHTYGPAPRLVASGSGGALSVPRVAWTTLGSYVVSSVGAGAGTWSVRWATASANNYAVRALCNGVVIAESGGAGGGTNWLQSTSIPERLYGPGDTLLFQVYTTQNLESFRGIVSWSWSLS